MNRPLRRRYNSTHSNLLRAQNFWGHFQLGQVVQIDRPAGKEVLNSGKILSAVPNTGQPPGHGQADQCSVLFTDIVNVRAELI
jgi:hypothetical protein